MSEGRVSKKDALEKAKVEVAELIKSKHCNPILVRLAWHDSGKACFWVLLAYLSLGAAGFP